MNNALTQSNDLNAFRSGLQAEHENFAAGLAAKQNSYMSNLANTRAKWSEKLGDIKAGVQSAETLLRTGLESEGGVAAGYAAAGAGKKAYEFASKKWNAYRNNEAGRGSRGGVDDETGSGDVDDPTQGGQFEEVGEGRFRATRVARPDNPNMGEDVGGEQGTQMRDMRGADRSGYDDAIQGETKEQDDEIQEEDQQAESSEQAEGGEGEGGGEGAGEGAGAEEGIEGAAEEGIEEGAAAGGEGILDGLAGAFSWVPFLGEVLGGAAAIAGIGTAIAGAVETVNKTAEEERDEKMAGAGIAQAQAARPVNQALNYAGGYVAPAQSSIQT